MALNIAIVSLGCSKNIVDSEIMMGLLKSNNFLLVESNEEADVIIINTCGFINDAKEESINTIIELGEYKETGRCKYLIVSGCLSERYKEELMKEMPEIDAIIGTGNVNEIVEVIKELEEGNKSVKVGNIDREYIEEHKRHISENTKTAYIKIAEGCDNYCTYCIIPKLRGKFRSRKFESILDEAKHLVESGVKEIILIAQDTTKYGLDLYGRYRLSELLDELNNIEDLEWIRVLYMYPETFSDDLINSIKKNDKVVKYVDIPIQHINNNVLKRMNRNTTKESISNLIHSLRENIYNIIIRTTLIVGFPGETESEYNELYEFVRNMKFERLGVFTYSIEEDTPAAKLPNQIEEHIKEERKDKIMELQKEISNQNNSKYINKIFKVLVEEKIENEDIYIGRTYMDSPEIDCIVYINSESTLNPGDFVDVNIFNYLEYDLEGESINESSK